MLSEPPELRMIDFIGNREHAVASAAVDKVHRRAREEMIRHRAYFTAQERGFGSGQELHEWLLAEWEIDRLIAAQRPRHHRYGIRQKSTDAASDSNAGAKRTWII
jgi:hypothetical protein